MPGAFASRMKAGTLDLFGVNLSGGAFGSVVGEDRVGWTHVYPTTATIDHFAGAGMDVIRLDVMWERVQRRLGGALDETELRHVDAVIAHAASRGVAVVLDVHNYARYGGALIGGEAVPTAAFADLWGKLAARYADDPNVIFGLMNEPNQHSAAQWLPIANAGIAAIRAAGAAQQILVPGSYWDGADTWVSSDNDTVMGPGVLDPLRNFAFEVHQYLDRDGSGTNYGPVADAEIGVRRLAAVTRWAEESGHKLFLGEFGVAPDPLSLAALDRMLAFMREHGDVWQGGTYFAAGEWWGDYPFSVQPGRDGDRPQMAVLDDYVSPQAVPYWRDVATTPTTPDPAPGPAPDPAPDPTPDPGPADPTQTTPDPPRPDPTTPSGPRPAAVGPSAVDAAFYLAYNPDVAAAGVSAEAHYAATGWREGRDPSSFFSTGGYLAGNRDVAAAGVNPLEHYLRHGAAEGRDPSAAFDNERYLASNPDVAAAGLNPLGHFLAYGRDEGRAAGAAVGAAIEDGFDAGFYLLSNPSAVFSGLTAREHYERIGLAAGRDPNGYFDSSAYLAANPDVATAGAEPLRHWMSWGWREGRDAGPLFDARGYLDAYPDVAAASVNPLAHFLAHGAREGRDPTPDLLG